MPAVRQLSAADHGAQRVSELFVDCRRADRLCDRCSLVVSLVGSYFQLLLAGYTSGSSQHVLQGLSQVVEFLFGLGQQRLQGLDGLGRIICQAAVPADTPGWKRSPAR
jgi:hypothetical protein